MPKRGVNFVLGCYVAVAVILGVGALVLYVSNSSRGMALEMEGRALAQQAQNVALELEEFVNQAGRLAESLALQKAVQEALEGAPARAEERLAGYMESYKDAYWSLVVFNDKGKVVAGLDAASKNLTGSDLAGNEAVTAVLGGAGSFVSKEMTKAGEDAHVFTAARAIKNASGKTVGGVAVFPRANVFFEKYVYPLRFGKRGYGFVSTSKNVTIAHAMDRSQLYKDMSGVGFIAEAVRAKNGVLRYVWKGDDKIMAFATAPSTQWTVCMTAYDADLEETAIRQSWVLCGVGLLVVVLLVAVITLISRRLVTRPALAIAQYAQRIAAQDYKAPLEGEYRYELGRLASDLKNMVADLKHRLGFAQGLLDAMTISCLVADPQENILFVNKPVLTFLERDGKPEDYLGWSASRFFYGKEGHPTITGKVLREKRAITGTQVEILTNKGNKAFTQIDAAPLYDLDGNLIAGFALFTDLTALKGQQEEIQAQNRRIAKAAEEVDASAELIAQASDELSAQIEESSRGADVQRERVGEMAASIEQMNSTVLEVAKNASQAADNSDVARSKAQQGADIVRRVVDAIDEVQRESSGLKENMGTLGQQVEDIGHIMNVISDIADQTNLLALNAAIEAARAGEAGRGFAVVADEVRKLAEKTMNATSEVGKAILGIQQGSRDAVARMDGAVVSVDKATGLAEDSGKALSEIVRLVETTSDQIRSIATASEEQSATSEEISRSMDDINKVSSETADAMDQSARAVSELAEQAGVLTRLIKDLRGDEAETKSLST